MEADNASSYDIINNDIGEDLSNLTTSSETEDHLSKVAKLRNAICGSPYSSLMKCIIASFQLSVVCGNIFGLCAILIWWIELNTKRYCIGKWNLAPTWFHHLHLIVDSVEAVIVMFWPLLTLVPVCSWRMIKTSNLILWCTLAGFIDVLDRFALYVFGYYETHWKSYIGNIVFSTISFIVYYKFTRYRQKQLSNNDNTILTTFKLSIQVIISLLVFLPYNYFVIQFYHNSTPLVRILLSCSVIAVFYVPKLILCNVITSYQRIYKPDESIIFAVCFLVISTMVSRLAQARIENFTHFIIVSLVHGIFNVLDKVTTKLRTKFFNWMCRRSQSIVDENNDYVTHYVSHQSLISIITETSSVILSNAAAYLLVYYYKREEGTGRRYDGSILLREMVIRSSIAVLIDWFFNIVALKIQYDRKIPVLSIWKREWKLILVLHLIQIIYVVVYFAHYVDAMLLGDVLHNSTAISVGGFKRL